MPGMNTGLGTNNPTIVQAFQSMLKSDALKVMLLLALLVIGWNLLQAIRIRREAEGRAWPELATTPEPAARRLLRISFGLIWIFDGLLQAQSSMPLGMTTKVIEPSAAASPSWVQHVANVGGTIWSNHPITAPVSAVWIQVGIGLMLLVAPPGFWSRLAGLSSAVWGLVVWVFGQQIHALYGKIQASLAVLSAKAQENLAGVRVVRAYVQEDAEIHGFDAPNREYIDRNLRLIYFWSLFMPLLQMLMPKSRGIRCQVRR